jgi:hypothetical protein
MKISSVNSAVLCALSVPIKSAATFTLLSEVPA